MEHSRTVPVSQVDIWCKKHVRRVYTQLWPQALLATDNIIRCYLDCSDGLLKWWLLPWKSCRQHLTQWQRRGDNSFCGSRPWEVAKYLSWIWILGVCLPEIQSVVYLRDGLFLFQALKKRENHHILHPSAPLFHFQAVWQSDITGFGKGAVPWSCEARPGVLQFYW